MHSHCLSCNARLPKVADVKLQAEFKIKKQFRGPRAVYSGLRPVRSKASIDAIFTDCAATQKAAPSSVVVKNAGPHPMEERLHPLRLSAQRRNHGFRSDCAGSPNDGGFKKNKILAYKMLIADDSRGIDSVLACNAVRLKIS